MLLSDDHEPVLAELRITLAQEFEISIVVPGDLLAVVEKKERAGLRGTRAAFLSPELAICHGTLLSIQEQKPAKSGQ